MFMGVGVADSAVTDEPRLHSGGVHCIGGRYVLVAKVDEENGVETLLLGVTGTTAFIVVVGTSCDGLGVAVATGATEGGGEAGGVFCTGGGGGETGDAVLMEVAIGLPMGSGLPPLTLLPPGGQPSRPPAPHCCPQIAQC
jgi:hypothetical protein